jgi:regulator of nucleoside diphosphate kinase
MIKDIKLNTKPEIIISSLDADRLYALMESLPANSFAGEKELEAEPGRANIVEPHEVPATVVTMNSTVNFVVESTGEEFTLTLVYPKNIDSSGNKISILAPIGSALLGLSQGDQIEWPKPGGGLVTVTIKEVTYQPERAGELHR